MNKKVVIITAIKPNELNLGGGPSGLVWEVINMYKNQGISPDVLFLPERNNKFLKLLHRYGLYGKRNHDFSEYDYIVVYPENLVMCLSKADAKRAIVLGPDSPSLRDTRIYKFMKPCLFRYLKCIYMYISYLHEYRVVSRARKVIVVGRTDQLWMKRNPFIKHCNLGSKIKFLRHPLLSKVIRNDDCIAVSSKRFFVLSGDLYYLHNYKFIEEMIDILKDELTKLDGNDCLNILIIGKRNKWIFDKMQAVPECNAEFIEWVKDYNDVCVPGKHIHCLPLLVGAGTKNRTLTALANGVEVITTPVGIENIPWKDVNECYIAAKPLKFVKYMLELKDVKYDECKIHKLLAERKKFREKVNTLFAIDFEKFFKLI